MIMFTPSSTRVSSQTDPATNARIHRGTEKNVAYYAMHPGEIDARLIELDQEWDIERMLETGSATATIAGLVLAALRSRRWLMLSLVVQGFFAQHAIQGWCPPLQILRRLGFRTQYEIEQERYALKSLRGDFKNVDGPRDALSAVGK